MMKRSRLSLALSTDGRPPAEDVHVVVDDDVGFRAVFVLDNTRLGPAVGGIRTRTYESVDAQTNDAVQLARAMTLKTALAGVSAGGGKIVVDILPKADRRRVFETIGALVDEFGGRLHTAGDFGTTLDDLLAARSASSFVHGTEGLPLFDAVATTVHLSSMAALTALGDGSDLVPRFAVQGVGDIGFAVAARQCREGAVVAVADIDVDRARRVAHALAATCASADDVLHLAVDVLSPCAIGGVLTRDTAPLMQARAIVAGANNIFVDDEAERAFVARGIAIVPDVVSSSGAVILGVARTIMGEPNADAYFNRVSEVAAHILTDASSSNIPSAMARELAYARINA